MDLDRLQQYTSYNQKQLEDELEIVNEKSPCKYLLKFALCCLLKRKDDVLKLRDYVHLTANVIRFLFYFGDLTILKVSEEIIKDINKIDNNIIFYHIKNGQKDIVKKCYEKGLINGKFFESLEFVYKENDHKFFELLLSLERIRNSKSKTNPQSLIDIGVFYKIIICINNNNPNVVYFQKLVPEFQTHRLSKSFFDGFYIPNVNGELRSILFDFIFKISSKDDLLMDENYTNIIEWCIENNAFNYFCTYLKPEDRHNEKFFKHLLVVNSKKDLKSHYYDPNNNLYGRKSKYIMFRKFIDYFLINPLNKSYLLMQYGFPKQSIQHLFQITSILDYHKEEKISTTPQNAFMMIFVSNSDSSENIPLFLKQKEKPKEETKNELPPMQKLSYVLTKLLKRDWDVLQLLFIHLINTNLDINDPYFILTKVSLFKKFGWKLSKFLVPFGDDLLAPADKYVTQWNKIRTHRKKNNTYKDIHRLRLEYQKDVSKEIYDSQIMPKVLSGLISEYC
jgi:hypothetical protein